ncbi:TIGR03086 family metal-binding protein [Streptosporangium saharense]|uniref:TIGR03086 family metal-binding protein n=1 Tax=Streptosporangium saharense TaxID=1706840 RepID=UPI0036875E29
MTDLPVEQLARALAAVDPLVAGVEDGQWSAPTPCAEWTVRDLVAHLVVTNRMMTAFLTGQAPPDRSADPLGGDPLGAYRESGTALRAAFALPGVLERTHEGALGAATGAVRLRWRLADLLTHAWDLSRATGRPAEMPQDLVEQALAFVGDALSDEARPGRFDPAQPVADDAPALDRLAAFAGRSVRP